MPESSLKSKNWSTKSPQIPKTNSQQSKIIKNPGKYREFGPIIQKNGPKCPILCPNFLQNPKIEPPKPPKYWSSPKSPKTRAKVWNLGHKNDQKWTKTPNFMVQLSSKPQNWTTKTPQIFKQPKITKNPDKRLEFGAQNSQFHGPTLFKTPKLDHQKPPKYSNNPKTPNETN